MSKPEAPGRFEAESCSGETAILKIGKALDFQTAHEFRIFCQEQIEAGMQHFVLDFSETRILDSTGLGAIFMLHRNTLGEVILAAATHPVQTVIQLTGLQRVFRQFPTAMAACEALKGR